MIRLVEFDHHATLEDYERVAHLSAGARTLREEAASLRGALEGRRVWMVNSTERGGGVAELLPPLLALLREVGIDAHWLVMEPDDPAFFVLTKHLHNMIHGEGAPTISSTDRDLYDRISRQTAEGLAHHVAPGDVVVVHDPQPLGAGAVLRQSLDVALLWRCHIGLDRETTQTRTAWEFLEGWLAPYDHAVFTAPEYIPRCLAGRATIVHPSIDPLSDKNRDLSVHKLVGILVNGGLVAPFGPVLKPDFAQQAERLQADGTWAPATVPDDLGLLTRPIVTQVSRWDHLKGFVPLLHGFARLKARGPSPDCDEAHRRTVELVRLVLAGPDPASVADDPEGQEALQAIVDAFRELEPEVQADVAVVSLPMDSRKNNALLVNALQRCSDVVAQNSLREGFGLTVTEAMWKRTAVLGSSAAGIRQQVRHGLHGLLVKDAGDPDAIADALERLLCDQVLRETMGLAAQQRVHDDFLVFAHACSWLKVLADVVERRWNAARR